MADLFRLVMQSGTGRFSLLLMLFLALSSSFIAALPPQFLGAIVNAAGGGAAKGAAVYSPLVLLNGFLETVAQAFASPVLVFSLLFFLFSCLAVLIRNIFVIFVSVCANRFIMHTRKSCLEAVLRARNQEISRFASGDVVHRIMADTKQLDYLVGVPTYVLASDIFDLLWVSFFIALLDWRILLILAAVFPVLYLLARKTGRTRRVLAKQIQESSAEGTGFVQRAYAGLDAIKVFGAEKRESDSFARLMAGIFSLELRSWISLGSFFCLEGALRAAGTICAIAYAAYLAQGNPVYAGAIPVLILYSQRFYAPLGNWARFYQVIQQSIVSFQRIRDILNLPREETAAEQAMPSGDIFPLVIDGSVLLDNGRRVSLDIRLDGPELLVLRGRSGIGKTRFTKGLLSLGTDFEGELRLGAGRWTGGNLLPARACFAYAAQDGFFLPGSVAENIAYPEGKAAMDRVRCRELLDALDLKQFDLDDEVEENARNLSLGEGRRLILGRALYSRRPVLVLDEIDANVDPETRRKIYELVEREKDRRPIIMITHVNGAELSAVRHRCLTLGEDGMAVSGIETVVDGGVAQPVDFPLRRKYA